ncbi:amidohydrolase family protein [Amycolatopsis anabasis]|uniref:amidohydrolase family protein n=1 Tax=Amycolatopsis anabasis TaxID=1840409 RepID=UPI001FE8472B|nr:amidohydrolase family protein [Amycolatopsis anabasis]
MTTPPHQASNSFVIQDVRIFDGTRVTGTGSVLVVDGRIAEIGRVTAPPGTPEYDGRGKTVLPGLIDGHTHSPWGKPDADRRDALRLGVTTELDMQGDPELIAGAKRQRESLERTDQADLWSAGIGITVPGGAPPEYPNLPNPPKLDAGADPGRFVADRIGEGSDYLKIFFEDGSVFGQPMPTLTPGQLHAIVAAAHRHGRMAIAHVTELEHARTAVEAGIDGLAHMLLTTADETFVEAIRKSGAFVTTTLSSFDRGLGADELLADPRVLPYLSAEQFDALKYRDSPGDSGWLRVGSRNVARLHAAGVPIFAGSDAGVGAGSQGAHGATLLAELTHLVRAGLTPAQALTAATAAPARRYRLTDRGRVAPGLRADLLLVEGNPAEDITAVREIAVIWKNGYPIDRRVGT